MIHLDLTALGLDASKPFKVIDLLHGGAYDWSGTRNYVELKPDGVSMHVFRVEQ
jgi:starch synthase (maltosyl-transferring)